MCPAAQLALPIERAEGISARAQACPELPEPIDSADPPRARVRPAEVAVLIGPEWAALAREAAEPNSFAEPWFVIASLATIDPAREPRIVEVRRGERLIGLVPLMIEDHYGRSPVRIVQNIWHHHMFLGTPLVRAGEEEAFWIALLDLLDAADWAPNFLHVRALVEDGPVHRGLVAAAAARGRACPAVHREVRALLASDLGARAYYERTVRSKKRKEIRRLRSRLEELGSLRVRRLEREQDLDAWCGAFLDLERSGWKGQAGTALACHAGTEVFFRSAIAGAWAAGRLDFLRLDLDERPIAMLVNFVAPPGSFSFKTCFDEEYARFSPGVLIQVENLALLDRRDIGWMDSCAVQDHPMIDSLWSGRRPIVRVTVRLKGARRTLIHAACRLLETGSTMLRRLFPGRSA
jgi:CelD/BcsL family acetyltransferase involved in cellulose biosynthesis